MKVYTKILAILTVVGFTGAANALIIDVTGTAGTGVSTWTFSGSSTASDSSGFCGTNCAGIYGTALADDTGWANVGNYITSAFNFDTVFATSSTASISINGSMAQSIDRLYLDDDVSANADDFGVGVFGGDLLFTAGDIISWTGALIMAVDLNVLAPEGQPDTYFSSNFENLVLSSNINLDMTLNIAPPQQVVSAPVSVALLGLGLVGLGWSQRKTC